MSETRNAQPGTGMWMPATPDPTALTREATALLREEVYRAVNGLRELLEARLGRLDASVTTFHSGFPSDVRNQINNSNELLTEKLNTLRLESLQKFDGIKLQFAERDVRTDQATEQNKNIVEQAAVASKTAIDAAFTANQKAADANAEYVEKSITKTEASTKEKIDGLQALLTGSIDDIRGQLSALTSRMDRSDGANKGSTDSRSERAQSTGVIVGISTIAATGISMIVGAVIFVSLHLSPAPGPGPGPASYGYGAPPTIVSPAVVPVQPAK